MNFSPYQWVAIIILDVSVRVLYFVAFSVIILSIPMAMFFSIPMALYLSFLHLTLLILISRYMTTFELPARAAAVVTIPIVNIIFCGGYILTWIYRIKSGHQTFCFNYKCEWINGEITWFGVQKIALSTLIQLAINLAPVLATWASSSLCRKKGPLL
jgi:hypothetical protein